MTDQVELLRQIAADPHAVQIEEGPPPAPPPPHIIRVHVQPPPPPTAGEAAGNWLMAIISLAVCAAVWAVALG